MFWERSFIFPKSIFSKLLHPKNMPRQKFKKPRVSYEVGQTISLVSEMHTMQPEIIQMIFLYIITDLEILQLARRVCKKWRELVDIEVVNVYKKDYDAFFEKADRLFAFVREMIQKTPGKFQKFNYFIPCREYGGLHIEYHRYKNGVNNVSTYTADMSNTLEWKELNRMNMFWLKEYTSISSCEDLWTFLHKVFFYDHLRGNFEIICDDENLLEDLENLGFKAHEGATLVGDIRVPSMFFGLIHDSPQKSVWASHTVVNIIKKSKI